MVHVFTALGAVCALLAALAIAERDWEALFLWLGVAFLIDGIDGTFARMVRVKVHLPRFSGDRIDLVVDYVTYVFVPVLALISAGYLEGPVGLGVGGLILVSSLYHFSDLESKAEDQSFVGFPAIWNIVAFYIFVYGLSPGVSAALIAVCIALTFVPMKWVHPLRVEAMRPLTIALTLAWSAAAVGVVVKGFSNPDTLYQIVLLAVAAYGIGLALRGGFAGAKEH